MSNAIICDRCKKLAEEAVGPVTLQICGTDKVDNEIIALDHVCKKCEKAIVKYAQAGFKIEKKRKEPAKRETPANETPTG